MRLKDIFLNRRITSKDKALFSRSLAATIEAGVPLVGAFTIVARESENLTLRKICLNIVERLEQGERLSTALQRFDKVFDEVYVFSIAAAEASGKLEEVLKDLAERQENDYEFESALKSAVAYPAFVLAALVLVTIFLTVLVVPTIQEIIAQARIPVPTSTRILISATNFFGKYYYIIVIAVIGLVLWMRVFKETPAGEMFKSRLVLALPIIREMYINVYMARFSKTFQMLLSSGVPLIKSLELIAKVMDNLVIRRVLSKVARQVERGVPISVGLGESTVFPVLVSQMVAVGEQTGKLEDVMKSLHELYQGQSKRNILLITSLLEPMLLVFIAFIIGFVIFALIIPIYKATGV